MRDGHPPDAPILKNGPKGNERLDVNADVVEAGVKSARESDFYTKC